MSTKRQEQDQSPALRFTIGDRLKKAREVAGISVQEMADLLGRQRNAITRYERAERIEDVQKMVIRLYALETGVPARWIEEDDGGISPGSGTDESLCTHGSARQAA